MKLTCTLLPLSEAIDDLREIRQLCRESSDFDKKLMRWLAGKAKPRAQDGHIALVREDRGRLVGWARSEVWIEDHGGDDRQDWDTLEACVKQSHRHRGIAAFAASALTSTVFYRNAPNCAVFRPSMMLVARRAGLWPTLFERAGEGWRRAE